MSVAARLAIVALKPMALGACAAAGVKPGELGVGPVGDLLAKRFAEHHGALVAVLKTAMDQAWTAVEIVLNGAAWWRGLTSPDDRPMAEALKPFLKATETEAGKRESIRRLALAELHAARKKGLLALGPAPAEGLARSAALYAKFADPAVVSKADRSAVAQMADELKKAGLENLAAWILPDDGEPFLATACRYFLERAVKDDAALAEGMKFADFDPLPADLAQGLVSLHGAMASHSRQLDEALGNVAASIPAARVAALDVDAEKAEFGQKHAELYGAVADLHRKLDLAHMRVRSGDAGAVRSEQERQHVLRTIAQFQALPAEQRIRMPALMNAIGQFEMAAGEFQAAVKRFRTVARLLGDSAAAGEAHMNAFRAAIEQPDHAAALAEFLEAVKADGKRFATFPVGKYLPARVIGSGGFGVAFLCKHKYLNAPVVVKALSTDHLERDMDDVFAEAQALAAINHPAIIKVQDCGYVDPGRKQRPFLVMDHFDGPTLEEYVKKNSPLDADEFLALAGPVVAGLEAAHAKNILHRDIKPANLLVKRHKDAKGNQSWDVKLIDFGLAVRNEELRRSSRGSKSGVGEAGTTEYASPEQLGRLEGVAVGPQSDIFGFAKTACFALFGTTSPLMKHWTSIPQPLAELLERCLNERPEDRPNNFTVVSRCFARLKPVSGAGEEIPVVSPIEPSRPASPTSIREESSTAPAEDSAGDYEYATAEQPSGGGRKVLLIVLMVFGTLGLMCCGGGGLVLYFGYTSVRDRITGGPNVETAAGDDAAAVNPARNAPSPRAGQALNRPANVEPFKNKTASGTLIVKNVPSRLVADYVAARISAEADGQRARGVKGVIKSGPSYFGDRITATIEADENRLAEFIRGMDLGAVEESEGNALSISLIEPPAPSRKPAERPELSELSATELGKIIQSLRANNWSPSEYKQLASAKPSGQFRSLVRSLLRTHAKQHGDAAEALGVWGTTEDVEFLIGLGADARNNEHVVKALAALRAPAGIPFIAKQLGDFFVGERAAEALRNFGPAIEKDVLPALSARDNEARIRACNLIKEFGSKAAIPALKIAAQDREERVSKAAWEAWKTIAFHPAEPVSAEPPTPVVSKPSGPAMLDDLKLTILSDRAEAIVPSVAIAPDGQSFYTLTPDDVRRIGWDGAVQATDKRIGMTLMAVSDEGVLVANSLDAKLLELGNLSEKRLGNLQEPRWITAAGNVGVIRCEGLIRQIMVVDVNTFIARSLYSDVKVPAGVRGVLVLPTGSGKSNPVLTPDARFMFTRGNGKLYRWKIDDYKLGLSPDSGPQIAGADSGQIVVSPDGKSVAWLHPDGNTADASFATKPAAGAATFVFDASDLKKPRLTLTHGPKPTALAFDGKGNAFMATASIGLLRFGPDGQKIKEYKLEGRVRQIVAHPDGDKLVILTDKQLLRVDLPK